jgi:uncharacterized membrane protein YciS (DUF1049 family)
VVDVEVAAPLAGKEQRRAFAAGRVWLFVLIGAVFFGAAGGSVIPFDSILWRSMFGALVGLLAGVALWLVLMAYFWLRAPYKQRDEARAMIREANDLRNLVYARDFLSRTLEANTRIIEDLAKQQRSGPVAEDDDPWIRRQNDETKRQLEMLGFSDLVPVAVLPDLKIETWEGVTADAKSIGRRLADALSDPRFHVLDRL